MNRREAIERTALLLGYAVSATALAGILKGCKAAPDINYKPVFFNEDQAALISTLAEIIIPKTTTPGAKEAGVPLFIDTMLHEVYPKKDQDSFLKGLAEFDAEAKKTCGDRFIDCGPAEQVAFVKKQHDAAFVKPVQGISTAWWGSGGGSEKPFILKVKELTLLGFFTSEAGATQVLQYNQVPGPYQGCVPLVDVGKTWAT
jgi:gluconate 2-dehydrogenase gamma chain